MHFNRKGQVSAPFKLLIAVVVFGLVLIILTFMTTQLQRQACRQNALSELDELASSLESVSRTQSQAVLEFDLRPCGGTSQVYLTQEADALICQAYCGKPQQLCTLLHYESEGFDPVIKCVNISPLTVFASAPSPEQCPDLSADNLELQDWRAVGIERADYVIASSESEDAVLCAYQETIETEFSEGRQEFLLPAIISGVFSPQLVLSTLTFLDSLGFWLYLLLAPLSAAAAYFSFERLSAFFGGQARAVSARRKELGLKLAASIILFLAPLVMAALTRPYWGIFLALLELLIVFAGFYWLKQFKKEQEFKAVKVKGFGEIKPLDLGETFEKFKPPKL